MAGRERSELRSDGAQHVSTYRAWLAAFFTLLTRLVELYCGYCAKIQEETRSIFVWAPPLCDIAL